MIVVSVAKAGLFSEDPDIVSDALWTIANIADTHDDSFLETMSEQDLIGKIVDELGS
jgi:hypothetical protein